MGLAMEQLIQRYLYGPPPSIVQEPIYRFKPWGHPNVEFCSCDTCRANPFDGPKDYMLTDGGLGSMIFAINLLNSRGS